MKQTSRLKFLFNLTTLLSVLSCFLPWVRGGDLLAYTVNGIHLFPRFQDNGGIIMVILGITMLVLNSGSVREGSKTHVIRYLSSILLLLLTVFQLFWVGLIKNKNAAVIGAPTIQIGLYLVLIGSLGAMAIEIMRNRKKENTFL
ncbi:MAG: hypothetical protein VB013_12095 [Anaerolineaceae bacterium]|nr:hypothetical protein [Anaerolineaceae bacterium]